MATDIDLREETDVIVVGAGKIRRRDPEPAGHVRLANLRPERSPICCARNTASRALPKKKPTVSRPWPSGSKASTRAGLWRPCGPSTPPQTRGAVQPEHPRRPGDGRPRSTRPTGPSASTGGRRHIRPPDPRPLLRRRNRRRPLLPQLRQRHGPHVRRRFWPPCREECSGPREKSRRRSHEGSIGDGK